MTFSNLCKHYSRICKGSCCEHTFLFIENYISPRLPSIIKKRLPDNFKLLKPRHCEVFGRGLQHGWDFSCDYFNKEVSVCMNYEKRPDLCKTYICPEIVEILALTNEPNEDLPW